jgi:putative endopeptidase
LFIFVGEAVSQAFVALDAGKNSIIKERVASMSASLKKTMRNRIIHHTGWMEKSTKEEALGKLDLLKIHVGYPDEWTLDFSPLFGKISKENSFIANYMLVYQWMFENMYRKGLLQSSTALFWQALKPFEVNAGYFVDSNTVVIPLGICRYPFYDGYDDISDLAGLGSIIAHELTHGFGKFVFLTPLDATGRLYDGHGMRVNWWTLADEERFNSRANSLIEQHSANHIYGRSFLGNAVIDEGIADLGGCRIAFHALKDFAADTFLVNGYRSVVFPEAKSIEQLFFYAYAHSKMHSPYDKETQLLLLETDKHPQEPFRSTVVLRNLKEFHEAFNLGPKDKMYREEPVEIW